ncbi:hypothetical protein Msil_3175 [Methylocella silvestris BL2]|uniref:DUF7007 domain-containing protein n=1 Tax=Methylocella silvestris (strain DSM 15510 / CIP 108128 / LMG 27833 / NCIMB 13906 / BL2) TaxID=395965 RepID=B8EMF5_METSB|nr:hypothetical protein [Methylocella silvestris]ACK52083.1 hypothetical protein Msil_3175 [Methylocella silvestris BL2]
MSHITLDPGDLFAVPASSPRDMRGPRVGPQPSLWDKLLRRPAPAPSASPWGTITEAHEIAPGVMWFRANARSGYRLSPRRQKALPRSMRTVDGWYEDTTEWAAVAVVFANIFDEMPAGGEASGRSLYELGKETLKHWRPEAFEGWFETSLDMDEIWSLPVMRFHRLHADRWMALGSFHASYGYVIEAGGPRPHVRAKRGGDPPYGAVTGLPRAEIRRFAVEVGELHQGRGKPFLIDPDRHAEIAIEEDAVLA